MLTRAYTRRLDSNHGPQRLTPELSERLDRMEQAMDAIAIEVERVSEGQRFITQLLAHRADSGPALSAGTSKGDAA